LSFKDLFVRRAAALLVIAYASPALAQSAVALQKLDGVAKARIAKANGRSRVVIQMADRQALASAAALLGQHGGSIRRTLQSINAHVVTLPNAAIAAIAESPLVTRLSVDRSAAAANERTSATIGATTVRQTLGVDGSGVGVAVIDSGVTPWHDDLAAGGSGQRVERFVDLVNGGAAAYDDYGHGTHVAGIIAGDGFDSSGRRAGVAPGASLTVIKALDGTGRGYISDVIAALEYVVAHRAELNIRVINLSVAAAVYESAATDPLTLAAKAAVDAGIVVVAAAGNNGRSQSGVTHYGGVGAPGNAPWVLTVGASSHMGTIDRSDDTIAAFSSRGPTTIDGLVKPDLVAPGVGTESLSAPDSALYKTMNAYLLPGSVPTSFVPYLSLSGTSMASPVVAGTVALMLQANPALTPNAVKAILQYTAQSDSDLHQVTQGAGFLNAKGAVELAKFLADPSGSYPSTRLWSSRIIWGSRLIGGGRLTGDANAWWTDVTWGADKVPGGAIVEWGVLCKNNSCDPRKNPGNPWRGDGQYPQLVWLASSGSGSGQALVWGVSDDDETVVWGTSDDDETVVWGTADDEETVVWGTSCGDPACKPVVWPN
jgi:subtilisin family serine protease